MVTTPGVRSLTVGALTGLLLGLAPIAAFAQSQMPQYIDVEPNAREELGATPLDVREATRSAWSSFRLFGEGDRAWTSLRLVGDNLMWETNSGPGDDLGGPMFTFFSPVHQFNTAAGSQFQTFGIPMMWAAPRSEWIKYLQEGVLSLQDARGAGFTVMWNGEIFGRQKDLNASDALVGTLLSGLPSTEDGSCRDHSATFGGATLEAGFQLLPGSNCPETWSNSGTEWLGDRPIPPGQWVEHFEELGTDFRFNRWQVPAERKNETAFLGNNFATYGKFNDFNNNTLTKFGGIVPGGSGDPSRAGWPLGLEVTFDAFSFTLPALGNVKFWSGLIVNESERLYGVPHDYDSVYVAFGMWPGRSGQDGDNYADPQTGAWVSSESPESFQLGCQRADPVPEVGSQNCSTADDGEPANFASGAHGHVVLKSPIGDLRNKLFTTAGSPFFMPSHPLAGDTITFNHAINWNFGFWGNVFFAGSQRRQFGVIASIAEDILDGLSCNDFFTTTTRWVTFRSNDWPSNQCNMGGWVPGDWTYTSGRPAGSSIGPDTLYLAGCGPHDGGGCPETWSDTTFQGWVRPATGNLSHWAVGPFALAAGDTTELVIAQYSQKDSVSMEVTTQGIVDFYMGLFAGPEAPPPVTIRDVDVGAGVTPGEDAEVTIVFDDAVEAWVDPFLLTFADDIENAAPGTDLAIIRDANPGLTDRIRARAAANVSRVLLFRSCDGGETFDSDGDCRSDPATDEAGNPVPPGWQAFATFTPSPTGALPNTFTDGNVTPGLTFLYSIIAETRGFSEVVINDPNFQVGEASASEQLAVGDGAVATFDGVLPFRPAVPGTVVLTDGVQVVTDDGAGNLQGDVGDDPGIDDADENVIDYATGEFSVTFALAPAAGVPIQGDWDFQFTSCGSANCQTTELVASPALLNPLARSAGEPNAISVYVPASVAAGARAASVRFREREITFGNRTIRSRDLGAAANVPFDVILTSRDVREERFTARFGNFVQVIEERQASDESLLRVSVTIQDRANTVQGDAGTVVEPGVLRSATFRRADGVPVTLNDMELVDETTVNDTLVRTFEITPSSLDPDELFATGMVLLERSGNANVPLLVTGDLTGATATPGAFLSNPEFPGFFVSADNSEAGDFDQLFWIGAQGDTLSTDLDPTLSYSAASSQNTGVQALTFGEYVLTLSDSVWGPGSPFVIFDNQGSPRLPAVQNEVIAALQAREAGTTGVTDDESAALVEAALGADPGTITLAPVRIPFAVENLTHGRTAQLAMVERGETTKRFGVGVDTLTLTIPANEWIPTDQLFVIENVDLFRTRTIGEDEAVVLNASGDPVVETQRIVTFAPLTLACTTGANSSCNPVRGPGGVTAPAGAWIGEQPGDELHLRFFSPFVGESRLEFDPSRSVSPDDVLAQNLSIRQQMELIQVVPNPYLYFSQYEGATDQRRLMFTNLPPNGEIRIYTVSGQFVQEIDWRPSDLVGNGDLYYDLSTREGNELGSGLYIFVATARDPASGSTVKKMGKFVVIR